MERGFDMLLDHACAAKPLREEAMQTAEEWIKLVACRTFGATLVVPDILNVQLKVADGMQSKIL